MRRDIFIGDIHGCFEELQQLLAVVGVTEHDRVISLGDLVDRGPHSVELWEFFRARRDAVVLMGNHERKHVRGVLSYSQEIVRVQFGARYEEFRAWASALPYFLEPRVWNDRAYGIDTGACHGGYLTALVVPGFMLHRVKAARDHWRVEQRRWQLPVLRTKPWATFRLEKIERELAAIERPRASADERAFVAELRAWLAAVDALVAPLIDRVHARREELQAAHRDKELRRAIAGEPCPALLFASAAGSLTPAQLLEQLGTPAAILDAARRYGLPSPEAPPFG